MLELRDKRYNDIRLVFDEPQHKYTDTLGNGYISTTTILHNYQPKFDKSYWLRKKSKELGISEKKLEQQWDTIKDEACERGSNTHNGLEDGIKGGSQFKKAIQYLETRQSGEMITVADIPTILGNYRLLDLSEFIELTENKYPQIYEVFQRYTDNGYQIYAEIGTFLIDFLVSGTIDVLLLREDKFVIGDWKTNRGGLKFEAGYFKKDKSQKPAQTTDIWVPKQDFLLPPVNNLPNCNGSVYNLQLSMYAFMVELILGIPCIGMWLCHIDSDFELNEYGQPKRFPDGLYHIKENPKEKTTFHVMQYRKQEIELILNDRRMQLEAGAVNTQFKLDLQ
mgnify:FL=1|jgi:hypothetical protein|uniref:Exonuclease V n=1 Tax=CrAss-like virus sp. ctUXy6 TaxID=2825835 RepID=A0A8S5V7I3_9CAUD|nr:MAG TPA: Exonuclease V [CrAss-like virus sp. ctUXy6]